MRVYLDFSINSKYTAFKLALLLGVEWVGSVLQSVGLHGLHFQFRTIRQ